jgi:hypothetical protein
MTARSRQRAFALACLAVLGVVCLLALTDRGEDEGREPGAATQPVRTPPNVARPPRATRARRGREGSIARLASAGPGRGPRAPRRERLAPPRFLRRERSRAIAVARRFLEALYAYEAGQEPECAAHTIRALATPRLAAELLQGPARLPATIDKAPPRAEILALAVEFDKPPTAAHVRAEVSRGGERSGGGAIVSLKDTRWTVTQLTE